MAVYLEGLALKNYRGFGPEKQYMGPFRDFNIFIGTNNSGKSAVLNFLAHHLASSMNFKQSSYYGVSSSRHEWQPMELHRQGSQGEITASFAVSFETAVKNVGNITFRAKDPRRIDPLLSRIIEEMTDDEKQIWINLSFNGENELSLDRERSKKDIRKALGDHDWGYIWHSMTGHNGGSVQHNWFPETFGPILSAQALKFRPVVLIPAIRQIGPTGEQFDDQSGKGLIDRLAEIQNPDLTNSKDRELFEKINKFLQTVTGDSKASINIPHNRQSILVDMRAGRLPLSSLGTGIHEVILIASICTLNSEKIICIEEPELHLHPLLQRKLIKYLAEETSSQYFIATHSPSFIDFPESATFHVTHNQAQTFVKETVLRKDRYAICTDLGHRASDIVQSNFVVWVEGPSDRVYIKHWIEAVDSSVVENIHFNVMFYGGRLLSQLSAESEIVDEFIDLRSLNRNLAIIIDSDKRAKGDIINSTKQRIVDAFDTDEELAWVTRGREIENYIPYDDLQRAVAETHPKMYGSALIAGLFRDALSFKRKIDPTKPVAKNKEIVSEGIDKINVARVVCEKPADLSILDLRQKVEKLVELIKRANQ